MSEVNEKQNSVQNFLEEVNHKIKSERNTSFRTSYEWRVDYSQRIYQEARTVIVPEGVSYNVLRAYQEITQADLRHMVIYNAFNEGAMDEDTKIELLGASYHNVKTVKKVLKEVKEDEEVGEEIEAIYKKVLGELVDEEIVKPKKKA